MKNEITPHRSNALGQVLKRGYEDRLVIDETTYDHQGDYVCEAINAIGGQRKIVQSDPIHIEVRGKGGRASSFYRLAFIVSRISLYLPFAHNRSPHKRGRGKGRKEGRGL